MRDMKFTVLEVAGDGDVELLDDLLNEALGVGNLTREFRLFNIKPLEHYQITLKLNGKTTVYQPFRAAYKKNERGNYTVTTRGGPSTAVATEAIKQMGFTVVSVQKGDYPENPIVKGFEITETVEINGRSVTVTITGEE